MNEAPLPDSRTVQLRSGGTLKIQLVGDFLPLAARDRELIVRLLEAIDRYEDFVGSNRKFAADPHPALSGEAEEQAVLRGRANA